mmetsp:Transcript_127/g.189  ORF Transcript_127/g.189 Transcript_127/m.189 type:complete len:353 (-) Transcript_127:185-1243(-)|eukprot:CAMPEP_0202695762 /NCGR_PEP_ID=MMETSP1385-20130828/9270_1 /ASSEMBLY_ACC=CAM_ASM_000861 /TAXON_ID=933848 /ORGANISM="Elphidium margaritaceum" /LENGTH=352 /DNA_ID=CAMNT_0049351839 /DNA_START=67 /DNA_END=1125 /DNA_ORIENTATION=+
MGCAGSSENTRSRQVQREIDGDKLAASKVHKLLLLGTGNSGKSTFFKQLQEIHGGGLQDGDFRNAAKPIQESIVTQMKNLLSTFTTGDDSSEFKDDLPDDLQTAAKRVFEVSGDETLLMVAGELIRLWQHQRIKDAFVNRTNLGIADSLPHFMDDLDRIKVSDYHPTAQDMLLARTPTTGMIQKRFVIKSSAFDIFDVGGQRSERSKWIHCFDTVHGVLFVASLSCYDQYLFEEGDCNAMDESLELFSIVCNSRYFAAASMLLFLNKSDLFEQKIKTKPLSIAFPNYDGEDTFQDGIEFISEQYKNQLGRRRDPKTLYTHVTCATDRDNVERLFDDVQHTVVTNALKHNGLI